MDFFNDSFVSVVQHNRDPGLLMIRARVAGDLEALFPGYGDEVIETPDADYRYRLTLPAKIVAARIAERVAGIDYPNFKKSVPDNDRHGVYSSVWSVMYDWQWRIAQRLKAGQKKARKARAVSVFD